MGGLRESCSHGSLNYLHGGTSSGFPWPVILLCPVPSLYLVYSSTRPHVCALLLAKMDSSKEAYELIDTTPFDLQEGFLHMQSQGGLLELENEM